MARQPARPPLIIHNRGVTILRCVRDAVYRPTGQLSSHSRQYLITLTGVPPLFTGCSTAVSLSFSIWALHRGRE
jgi:hypothetical protein